MHHRDRCYRRSPVRVRLALNVSDINEAVEFYTKLFGTGPAKRQPGYANFAVTDPPLKLVLMEDTSGRGTGIVGALNHLGVEVETPDEVAAATGRLSNTGIETEVQEQTTCCYAVQDKVWVSDPDGAPWEFTPSSPTPRPRPASPATVVLCSRGSRQRAHRGWRCSPGSSACC